MRDVAMNSAAQVEAATAPAHLFAAHQPRAHTRGEPRRKRVGRRHVVGIDDMAEVRRRERLGARGALAAAAPVRRRIVAAGAPLDVIRQCRARPGGTCRLREPPRQRRAAARARPVKTCRCRMWRPCQ